MFGKLLRNHSRGRGGGAPPSRSPRGTPSSESKGKRPASPSPRVALGGSSKKWRMSSLSTPPSSSKKHLLGHPHLPILTDERGVPLKYSRAPSNCLHSPQSLEIEKGGNLSLVGNLMRGAILFERLIVAGTPVPGRDGRDSFLISA
ncbi:UNVERIFIED_CONTAM: hypothetical protein Sradi_4120900 [Sesamum radiatum]|uniref:Uncharacterized protein n=1 Tax=Sesamum radiatum TaxID=300843 RepID=A0AAW2P1E9_SESRA